MLNPAPLFWVRGGVLMGWLWVKGREGMSDQREGAKAMSDEGKAVMTASASHAGPWSW
jgi:hypothetical protein